MDKTSGPDKKGFTSSNYSSIMSYAGILNRLADPNISIYEKLVEINIKELPCENSIKR